MVVLIFISVREFYKQKHVLFIFLSSFLNKVIYLGPNYIILIFPRLGGLFQVYNDVSNQAIDTFETI